MTGPHGPEDAPRVEGLRWGILGAARIARRRMLPAMRQAARTAVVAIASRRADAAAELAHEFAIPAVYGSYDELLADPAVDAVYNPLPNNLHAHWTIAAARRGKHVLCEKPIAVSAAEAAAMVAACRDAGVVLQEAFMYRFHPQIDEVRRRLAAGAIGDVRLVRSAFSFRVGRPDDIRLQAALGGGGLMDVGCYCVSISRLLLGEPAAAFATATFERGVDVALAGMLSFGTTTAQFDCGLLSPYRQFCEVVGTDGAIVVPRPFQPEDRPVEITVRRGDHEERLEIPGTNQYTLMLEHVAACVIDGAVPRFPADDALANMRTLDALAQSARTGEPVRL
ncbi:MAG TPA: Gfo/Idh/MocA family oxidoreductase [bacterium]|jgi:predicted dehydrogenase